MGRHRPARAEEEVSELIVRSARETAVGATAEWGRRLGPRSSGSVARSCDPPRRWSASSADRRIVELKTDPVVCRRPLSAPLSKSVGHYSRAEVLHAGTEWSPALPTEVIDGGSNREPSLREEEQMTVHLALALAALVGPHRGGLVGGSQLIVLPLNDAGAERDDIQVDDGSPPSLDFSYSTQSTCAWLERCRREERFLTAFRASYGDSLLDGVRVGVERALVQPVKAVHEVGGYLLLSEEPRSGTDLLGAAFRNVGVWGGTVLDDWALANGSQRLQMLACLGVEAGAGPVGSRLLRAASQARRRPWAPIHGTRPGALRTDDLSLECWSVAASGHAHGCFHSFDDLQLIRVIESRRQLKDRGRVISPDELERVGFGEPSPKTGEPRLTYVREHGRSSGRLVRAYSRRHPTHKDHASFLEANSRHKPECKCPPLPRPVASDIAIGRGAGAMTTEILSSLAQGVLLTPALSGSPTHHPEQDALN